MFDEFRKHLIFQSRSELTIRGYVADLKIFSAWFQQKNSAVFAPEKVTPDDIKNYSEFLLAVKKSRPTTINRQLASIAAYFNWAVNDGRIKNNPSSGIRSIRMTKDEIKCLDHNEQKALKNSIEKEIQSAKGQNSKYHAARLRDALLILFLLNTGLRLSEALRLELDDLRIDDDGKTIVVGKDKKRNQRFVPLNRTAYRALQNWLGIRPKCNARFIWIAIDERCERALSGRSVQRSVARIGLDAGIQGLSPHVLRHTFGKNLISKGGGIELAAKLLGHSNLQSTLIYFTPDIDTNND